MPGISRFGINQVLQHLEPLVKNGLKSILLFGVIEKLPKVINKFDALKMDIVKFVIQTI